MDIHLTDEQADELRETIDGALDDLSTEIAATDNPSYRALLNRRRTLLRDTRATLGG
jgi:hypothetical protein